MSVVCVCVELHIAAPFDAQEYIAAWRGMQVFLDFPNDATDETDQWLAIKLDKRVLTICDGEVDSFSHSWHVQVEYEISNHGPRDRS